MNQMEMLEKFMEIAEKLAVLEAEVTLLHRMVDAEETRTMRRGYSRDIDTETIRDVFGWAMCDEAKNAGIEYEAAKAAKEEEE